MKSITVFIVLCLFQLSAPAQETAIKFGGGLNLSVERAGVQLGSALLPSLHLGVQSGLQVIVAESIYGYPIYDDGYFAGPYLKYLFDLGTATRPFLQAEYSVIGGTVEEKLFDGHLDHKVSESEIVLNGGVEYFINNSASVFVQARFFMTRFRDGTHPAFQFGIPRLGAEWFF